MKVSISLNQLKLEGTHAPLQDGLYNIIFSLWSVNSELIDIKRLETLELAYTSMTKELANEICGLPALKSLSLKLIKNVDLLLERFAELRSLESLTLDHPHLLNGEDSLIHLSKLRSLKSLSLEHDHSATNKFWTRLSGESIKHACNVLSLETLKLDHLGITDRDLTPLTKLANLTELGLKRIDVGDSGLATVATLTKLRSLNLDATHIWGTKATAVGYAHLQKLQHLEQLDLTHRYSPFGPDELKEIGKITSLRHLNLRETATTDECLAQLTQLKLLETLDLSRLAWLGKVTDKGLKSIVQLKSLKTLHLPDNTGEITSVGLPVLKDLENLRHLSLWLRKSDVSPAVLNTLQKLPSLEQFKLCTF